MLTAALIAFLILAVALAAFLAGAKNAFRVNQAKAAAEKISAGASEVRKAFKK